MQRRWGYTPPGLKVHDAAAGGVHSLPPDAAALGWVDPPDQADAAVNPQRGPIWAHVWPRARAGPGLGPFAAGGSPQKTASWKKQRTIYLEMSSFTRFSHFLWNFEIWHPQQK